MGKTNFLSRKTCNDHFFYGVFCLWLFLAKSFSKKIIDLEGYDCTYMKPFMISDTDLVNVIARPRVDVLSRAVCVIRLKTEASNRKFNIYVNDINIRDCGVKLDFFDSDPYLKTPFKSFNCQSSPGDYFTTKSNSLTIRLGKQSSAATRYQIQIELATNMGPKIQIDSNNKGKTSYLAMTTLWASLVTFWFFYNESW